MCERPEQTEDRQLSSAPIHAATQSEQPLMDGAVKKPSRAKRTKRALAALHGEVTELQTLAETLLGHLEAAIRPNITDAARIRYRCMIQDIRQELRDQKPIWVDRILKD